jgi:hypothetical protein
MCLKFSSFEKFCLAIQYRVGAGAAGSGAAPQWKKNKMGIKNFNRSGIKMMRLRNTGCNYHKRK